MMKNTTATTKPVVNTTATTEFQKTKFRETEKWQICN